MEHYLELFEKHKKFFQLKKMVASEENETELFITGEAQFNEEQKMWIEKKESQKLKQLLSKQSPEYVLTVRYESGIFDSDKEDAFITWVKTPRFTIQFHYFDDEGWDKQNSLRLNYHVSGYYIRELEELSKEYQEEIKKIALIYTDYVKEKSQRNVMYEEEQHYFLYDTPVEERYVIEDTTFDELREWMDEDYNEFTQKDNMSPEGAMSRIAEDWFKLFRNQVYAYVVLCQFIEWAERDIKEDKEEEIERLEIKKMKIKKQLNKKQIEILKKENLL